jgi:protein involved in sex pheromone biosynthesis
MFRILLIAIVACSLSISPAFSQMSQQQQKQVQKRESSGESVTQTQRGGLKRDRQISREIFRNANNRMRDRHQHNHR